MKTMILDNNIDNIRLYDQLGIDRIFVDLEIIGKVARQGGMDTVISDHSLDDIKKIKPLLSGTQLLVRVNPIHSNSVMEITQSIENGADIVMLPMFKTVAEVASFVRIVDKRAVACILLETSEALCRIDDILEIEGIDEIHIGLNDLHLSLGLDFMFELLGCDLIEFLTKKIRNKNIPFGIGGVGRMDHGMLNGRAIMIEHVRLGSSMVILSRSFKGNGQVSIEDIQYELLKLQQVVLNAMTLSDSLLLENKSTLKKITNQIATKLRG
ncbi:aldolase/citrate lyase family protein [Colwellia sp. C1TZA3]|uniref:aldolase/citrate lyase family protein n=1 Tax=Colwellia sp. C1TZA3 TaxID=2508879 RepID=UPI0011B9CD2A|nr:aldolase/citrate lyase family protein [Colwellia sp. C1TZA3]TWX72958.1 aldolase [Colwellia sp. C1TZA3]